MLCKYILLVGLVALGLAGVVAQNGCTPLTEAMVQPGHTAFARIFEAANIKLNASEPYTVLVPEDGSANDPSTSGASGILGLFASYGIDTSSVQSMRDSDVFSQIVGFIKYYIVRGGYSLRELQGRDPANHLRTIFNVTEGTCVNVGELPSEKDSDGDLKIEMQEGRISLTDDSSNTVMATVIKESSDIKACDGSYVHLIKGILNPCCDDSFADCTIAALDPKQIDPKGWDDENGGEPNGLEILTGSARSPALGLGMLLGVLGVAAML